MEKLLRLPACTPSSTCTLELIFFLYKVGESLLDATIRPYIIQATCLNVLPYSNESVCEDIGYYPEFEDLVQPAAAFYIMLHRITLYAPAIVLGLFFGAWSDKFGRKIPIIFPSMGSVIGVVFYISSLMERNWNITLIIVGGVFQGALGKSSVVTMAVHSYAADITEKEQRTKKMGKILSMNFFGLFAGSLLSGLLADWVGIEVMFCIVSLFHATAILTTVFCLAETVHYVKENKKQTFECSSFFNLTNVKDSLMVIFRKREDGARSIVITIFLISVLQITCKTGEMDTTVLFVQHRPLSWSKSGYGYLLSIDYAVMGVCLFFVLPLLSNVLKISDTTIIMAAIFCKVARLMWAAFLNKTWMMYVSIGLGAMGGLMISALRSLLSKSVNENEIGKTFSLLGCGETASKLLGTAIFTNIYSATAKIMPGMVYLIEAAVFFLTLLMMIWVTIKLQRVLNYRLLDDASPKKNYSSQDSPDIPLSKKSIFEPDTKPDFSSTNSWLGDKAPPHKEASSISDKKYGGENGSGVPVANGRSVGSKVTSSNIVATSRGQWRTFDEDDDDDDNDDAFWENGEDDMNDPKFGDGDRRVRGDKNAVEPNRQASGGRSADQPQSSQQEQQQQRHAQQQRQNQQQPPPRPPPPVIPNAPNGSNSYQRRRHHDQEAERVKEKTPVMMEMKVLEMRSQRAERNPLSQKGGNPERVDETSRLTHSKNANRPSYASERGKSIGQTGEASPQNRGQ